MMAMAQRERTFGGRCVIGLVALVHPEADLQCQTTVVSFIELNEHMKLRVCLQSR